MFRRIRLQTKWLQNGLYVHLSKDIPTAINVGQRHGKPAVFTIQAEEMSRKGYKFFLSVNRVWLTKYVPVEYLKKIIYPGDTLPNAEPFKAEATDDSRREILTVLSDDDSAKECQ